MISPKYDSTYIENELRNSRRLVEKSIELSKRYTPTDSNSQERFQELVDRLRNEEYLKLSYEKALKDNILLLKQEQKKNLMLEQKIDELEQRVLELTDERLGKVVNRIDELESKLKASKESQVEGTGKVRKSNKGCTSLIEQPQNDLTDSERFEVLQRKLNTLERLVKSKKVLKATPSKSKSLKSLPKKKSIKST